MASGMDFRVMSELFTGFRRRQRHLYALITVAKDNNCKPPAIYGVGNVSMVMAWH